MTHESPGLTELQGWPGTLSPEATSGVLSPTSQVKTPRVTWTAGPKRTLGIMGYSKIWKTADSLGLGLVSPSVRWTWYCVLCLVAQSCPTLCDPMNCSPSGSSVHGDSPGKNTRVDCHALLHRIFLTQGSNPGLPHCRRILYHLNHQGRPDRVIFILNDF